MNPRRSLNVCRAAVSRRVSAAATAVSALALATCADGPETYEIRGRTMGTTYTVKMVAAPGGRAAAADSPSPSRLDNGAESDAAEELAFTADDTPAFSLERLAEVIETELGELEAAFSTYRPESEVSRFNAHPGQDWFPVSPAFLDVLRQATEVSELTGGAFDATVGPLVEAWGFGPSGGAGAVAADSGSNGVAADDTADGMPQGGAARPPSTAAVVRLLESTGFSRLQTRETPPAVRRLRPGVRLDFSGIAKGYAVDRIASSLSEAGLSSHLVEIGGEVRGRGVRADGRAWSIGIESPDQDGAVDAVPLRDAAVATSGDYRNYFEHGGERYSHVLDPRTGWPVSHGLTSVTLVAASAARADALATALLVLGPEAGPRLAVDHGLAARFVVRTPEGFEVLLTPAYEAGLQQRDN